MKQTVAFQPLPQVLKLLAHELRWKLLSLLTFSDYRVQELVNLLGEPQNLVSYHLRQLRTMQLVAERHSSADERSVYYSLDLERVQALYQAAGTALHPALGMITPGSDPSLLARSRVLFLCTENSARSQIAEGLLRHLSHGQVDAYSAGSHPTQVHPLTRQVLTAAGIDSREHFSKSIELFHGQTFDYIITVCDRVRETCPTFPGDPACIHWSFPDPTLVEGTDEVRSRAFEHLSFQLTTRIRFFLTLLSQEDRRSS